MYCQRQSQKLVRIWIQCVDCLDSQRQWVVGTRTFKGNPHDGDTLFEAFDQIKAITDHIPKQVYVERSYRAGYLSQQTDMSITGQKRQGKATKLWMIRTKTMEPNIGNWKAAHKMQG